MTVSRVIRNDPHVSDAAKTRVQRALAQVNYTPNPLLGILMNSLRSAKRRGRTQFGLAYVADSANVEGGFLRLHQRFAEGARRAAERLGYRLEVFEGHGDEAHLRFLRRVVTARGLLGVLFGPMQENNLPRMSLDFAQPHLIIGEQWPYSIAHRVENDQVHAAKLLLDQLTRRGYKRFGWMTPGVTNPEADYLYRVVFSHVQLGQRPGARVPIFGEEDFNERNFRAWFRKHRPDVLICKQLDLISPWLARMGLRTPDDVGLCSPDIEPDFIHVAGVVQLYERVSGTAVELIDGMIRRNESGTPEIPTYTLIEGRWNEGQTLRPSRVH